MAISKNESVKKVNLNLKGLSIEEKLRAKRLAGEILVEGIQSSLDSSRSPVAGFGSLEKKADNTPSTLFLDGDMRSQITFEEGEEDAVLVGIFEEAPEKERLKAFNHNTGDTLPQRRFIAAPNQKFDKPIMDNVNRAIKEIREQAQEEMDQIIRSILDEI